MAALKLPLAGVVQNFRGEISMIRDFASETDAKLADKKPVPPSTPFSAEERMELKKLGEVLLSAASKQSAKGGASVTTTLSDRVGEFLLQAVSPIKQRGFLAEMALGYLISYLEAFIKDYVLQILIAHPRMLRSNATMTFDEAIGYKSIKGLRAAIAEKEVEALGYGSIDDVAAYFQKKLNISLSAFPQWKELREHVYRRNLVVHNQARVNGTYRRKVDYQGNASRIGTDMVYVEAAAARMLEFIDFVHAETSRKLRLDET